MTIFYLLTILASLPIIAYLFAQKTSNKGIIFGISVLVLCFCLTIFCLLYTSPSPRDIGILNNKIFDQIYVDSKISTQFLKEIEDSFNEVEIKNWLVGLITKSIDLKKLNSAESLIAFSERFFVSSDEKIIFYQLYTLLRDEKFPVYKNASFIIDFNATKPCEISSGEINLSIMNGPKIPIAKREFINLQNLKLTNLDSVLPGFDLASAYLNEESIELNIDVICASNNEKLYIQNIIVLDKNRIFNTYKIDSNEWLKKSQEL